MKYKPRTKLAEWQERCKNGTEKCAKCEETRDLTVDHIVPVELLEKFMLDRIYVLYEMDENFQILCRYCNRSKSCNIDVKNPVTYKILNRVLFDAKCYYILEKENE